jgi:hypothetical protein
MDDVMIKAHGVAIETKVLGQKDGEPEGTVSAIVAVTSNRDQGGDVILPGALKWGLDLGITPKGVTSHQWENPVAKAIQVVELMPTDTALPTRLMGKGLGGMRVKAQYNLKSKAGEEAFETVRFFGDDQEWSIGYAGFGTYLAGPDVNKDAWEQVCKILPESTIAAIKSASSATRFLPQVKTYEFSSVLFGMNADTITEQVKSGDATDIEGMIERAVAKAIERIKVVGQPAPAPPLEVKLWVEDDALPGTAEAFIEAVRGAANAWMADNVTRAPQGEPGAYPYVRVIASYPDSCIVTIDGLAPDPDTGEDDITLRFPLTFDGDEVTLGTPEVVELTINVESAAPEPAGSTPGTVVGASGATATAFDVHVLGLEEAIGHVAGAVADDAKAGAVQARRNRERLTTALGAIQAMVDELPADDPEKTGEDALGDSGASGDDLSDPVAVLRAELAAETADVDELVGAATIQ